MAGNERMLNLAAALGFRRTASEDVSLVRVVKALA
jgi:hypothetical protein